MSAKKGYKYIWICECLAGWLEANDGKFCSAVLSLKKRRVPADASTSASDNLQDLGVSA